MEAHELQMVLNKSRVGTTDGNLSTGPEYGPCYTLFIFIHQGIVEQCDLLWKQFHSAVVEYFSLCVH